MMKKLPKRLQKTNRLWLYGGLIIMGIVLLWILNPTTQSIIPSSNFTYTPTHDQELEGIGAKSVRVIARSTVQDFPDHEISTLSFYVTQVGTAWRSDTFFGTKYLVQGTITVPDNSGYIINLNVQIRFFDGGEYYTETHTSRFGVFDPDYAGEEDEDFYSTTTTTAGGGTPFDFGGFTAPLPIIPVFGALIILWRSRKT